MKNLIIDEIHRYRREQAEKFHDDISAYVADVRKRQSEHPGPIRTDPLKPRRVMTGTIKTSDEQPAKAK